eukprot:scaffold40373_cov19-Tisochrysis_lutea.AAC.2
MPLANVCLCVSYQCVTRCCFMSVQLSAKGRDACLVRMSRLAADCRPTHTNWNELGNAWQHRPAGAARGAAQARQDGAPAGRPADFPGALAAINAGMPVCNGLLLPCILKVTLHSTRVRLYAEALEKLPTTPSACHPPVIGSAQALMVDEVEITTSKWPVGDKLGEGRTLGVLNRKRSCLACLDRGTFCQIPCQTWA